MFYGEKQRYKAKNLIHNKEMANLSFACIGLEDSKQYEITSLHFEKDSSQASMVQFLTDIRASKISNLKIFKEFYEDEDPTGRLKLVLIDRYVSCISIRDLVIGIKDYPFISEILSLNQVRFPILVSLWETIRDLRSNGLKNIGITSWMVYLIDSLQFTNTNTYLSAEKTIENLFGNLMVKIDYKFSHFKRLLLADAKQDLTLKELADLRFFSRCFVQVLDDKHEALSDHNCFILFALELFGKEKHENFLEFIDFKKGFLKQGIEDKLGDDCSQLFMIVEMCFNDRQKAQNGDFFSEKNEIFSLMSNIKNQEYACLQTIESIDDFKHCLGISRKSDHLQILLDFKTQNFSKEKIYFITEICVHLQLISDATDYLQDFTIPINKKLVLLEVMNFFLSSFFENRSLTRKSIDKKQFRQYFVLTISIYETFREMVT